MIEFEQVPLDQPLHGPPCGVHPEGHTWRLRVEEGAMQLTSGCDECDDEVLGPIGGEDVYMAAELVGRLVFEPDHPNLGGWHGDMPCDCGYVWLFEPRSLVNELDSKEGTGA